MKSKNKITKLNVSSQKRLFFVMVFLFLLLILLIIRIAFIQFVDGPKLKKFATQNQLLNKTIPAKRGTIYDANGKGLALSAKVDNIFVNPSQIKYSDNSVPTKDVLAHAFSDIFELDYDETLEKLNKNNSNFIIAKKVENDKVAKLQEWMKTNNIKSGINIEEDIKRYYPYNNLASNLIGFTGTDNYGLCGLEATLNDQLSRYTSVNL